MHGVEEYNKMVVELNKMTGSSGGNRETPLSAVSAPSTQPDVDLEDEDDDVEDDD